jgi:hypothetical protein
MANHCFHLAAQPPKTGFNVQQSHARAAETQDAALFFY